MLHQPPPAETDILCESCGYTLNGLPDSHNCPECGMPITASTTASPRRPPAWEGSAPGTFSTFFAVLFTPREFFRTLNIHADDRRSRWFAVIAMILTSLIATATINAHYQAMAEMMIAPTWLPGPLFMYLALPVLIFGLHWITLGIVGVLTALEGRYWGYRTPRPIVRRTIHYVSFHAAVAWTPPLLIALTYLLLLNRDKDRFVLHMADYLYVLSGSVIVMAIYLFKVYWVAMKLTLFANRTRGTMATAIANPSAEG
jgi:hypothetical protein